MRKLHTLIVLAFALLLVQCTQEDNPVVPVTTSKHLVKFIQTDTLGNLIHTEEWGYDSQGRVKTVEYKRYDRGEMYYNAIWTNEFTKDSMVSTVYNVIGDSISDRYIYYLDETGKALKLVNTIGKATTSLQYDASNQLQEINDVVDPDFNIIMSYTWENGNIANILTRYDDENFDDRYTYTTISTELAPFFNVSGPTWEYALGLYGARIANYPAEVTYAFDFGENKVEYTDKFEYTFDSEGYLISYKNGMYVYKLQYR